jgi:hypothetical protein
MAVDASLLILEQKATTANNRTRAHGSIQRA